MSYIYHVKLLFNISIQQWLEEDFLSYLSSWESSVERLTGLTKTQKGNLLLIEPCYQAGTTDDLLVLLCRHDCNTQSTQKTVCATQRLVLLLQANHL